MHKTTGVRDPAVAFPLPSLRDELDWRKVHLWWTDDRFVPPDHPLSNVKLADEILLVPHRPGEPASGGVSIPSDQVHPFATSAAVAGDHDSGWCAHRYAEDLQANGPDPNDDGWPVFDLILLGIGPDGHILSVFPGSETFDRREWALGVRACVQTVQVGSDDVFSYKFLDSDTKCMFKVRGGPSMINNDLIATCAKTARDTIGKEQIAVGGAAPATTPAPATGSAGSGATGYTP